MTPYKCILLVLVGLALSGYIMLAGMIYQTMTMDPIEPRPVAVQHPPRPAD